MYSAVMTNEKYDGFHQFGIKVDHVVYLIKLWRKTVTTFCWSFFLLLFWCISLLFNCFFLLCFLCFCFCFSFISFSWFLFRFSLFFSRFSRFLFRFSWFLFCFCWFLFRFCWFFFRFSWFLFSFSWFLCCFCLLFNRSLFWFYWCNLNNTFVQNNRSCKSANSYQIYILCIGENRRKLKYIPPHFMANSC